MTHHRLVRILRSVSKDPIDGYLIGRGHKWLLVHAVDDAGSLDGYTLIRNDHLAEVSDRGSTGQFVRRHLELHHQWPPTGPSFPVDLDRTRALAAALTQQGLAVGVHIEKEDPDVIFVGVPFRHKRKTLGLHEIDSAGEWRAEDSRWQHRRLTRIDFSSRYLIHLLEVARHYQAPAPNTGP